MENKKNIRSKYKRNSPCYCGSGRKYKHCHLISGKRKSKNHIKNIVVQKKSIFQSINNTTNTHPQQPPSWDDLANDFLSLPSHSNLIKLLSFADNNNSPVTEFIYQNIDKIQCKYDFVYIFAIALLCENRLLEASYWSSEASKKNNQQDKYLYLEAKIAVLRMDTDSLDRIRHTFQQRYGEDNFEVIWLTFALYYLTGHFHIATYLSETVLSIAHKSKSSCTYSFCGYILANYFIRIQSAVNLNKTLIEFGEGALNNQTKDEIKRAKSLLRSLLLYTVRSKS